MISRHCLRPTLLGVEGHRLHAVGGEDEMAAGPDHAMHLVEPTRTSAGAKCDQIEIA
jgi:hypothetical protein